MVGTVTSPLVLAGALPVPGSGEGRGQVQMEGAGPGGHGVTIRRLGPSLQDLREVALGEGASARGGLAPGCELDDATRGPSEREDAAP